MSYWFRVRFRVPHAGKIDSNEQALTMESAGEIRVSLHAAENVDTLRQATEFSILGHPFDSEDVANREAQQWRDAIAHSLLRHRVGADFSINTRKAGLVLSTAGKEMISRYAGGRTVVEDAYDISVFEVPDEAPDPVFVRGGAVGVGGVAALSIVGAAREAKRLGTHFSTSALLSFDLYAEASFQPRVEGKLMMLAIALEALVDPKPRASESVELIDRLISEVNKSERPDREAIASGLRDLRTESISQAAVNLADDLLGPRTMYLGGTENQTQFIKRTYRIRSKLVHGAHPMPDHEEMIQRTSELDGLVSNLLAKIALTSTRPITNS